MSNVAKAERQALCDLMIEVGPDAPTLCEGWTTRDLAAHLVVQETRPDAALGIVLKPVAKHGESVRRKVAARPWTDLVAEVRGGPPVWSPMRMGGIDEATNSIEFFVHHEDVRRARPDWAPRTLDPVLEDQMRKLIKRGAKLMARKAPCGLVLVETNGASIVAKDTTPMVEVHGPIGELVLFVYGRQRSTQVTMNGMPELVAAMNNAHFGI